MPDAFWLAAALLCSVLGMAWQALAMEVHWRQAHGSPWRSPHERLLLRFLGWLALTASLVFCLQADTATMAVLVWMMLLAVAAAGIAFLLGWRPRSLALAWPRVRSR